jgi:hypothetical protein
MGTNKTLEYIFDRNNNITAAICPRTPSRILAGVDLIYSDTLHLHGPFQGRGCSPCSRVGDGEIDRTWGG